MGKSKETKQVNRDLASRYKDISGGNNPFDKFAEELHPRVFDTARSDNAYNDLMGRFGDIAGNGGVTPENASRIRGNGVYDEFAKTGGYNAADIANIRSR